MLPWRYTEGMDSMDWDTTNPLLALLYQRTMANIINLFGFGCSITKIYFPFSKLDV